MIIWSVRRGLFGKVFPSFAEHSPPLKGRNEILSDMCEARMEWIVCDVGKQVHSLKKCHAVAHLIQT